MATYTNVERPFAITTELGDDALLLTGLRGHESISELFNFQVDLVATAEKEVAFDRILGQSMTIQMRLPDGETAYLSGIVKRFTQGARDATTSRFRAEVVPKLWLLTKKIQSRIFQHLSVPDILREVLSGLDVSYQIHDVFAPRDYCVQYRESDFRFASRLMEEEGIHYFFTHSDGGHQMIVTNQTYVHPDIPGKSCISYYELVNGGHRDESIWSWEKSQEVCSGAYTLRDHCFEMPSSHLEARAGSIDGVSVGKVNHKLRVGGNDQLEIYDYPGGYAQRFDGVDRNGQLQPRDLQAISSDGQRTVIVRMEQEEVAALEIRGVSNCTNFMAGHKFTLEDHFDGDGDYLLTRVEHHVQIGDNYLNGNDSDFHYDNHFTCIPTTLSYRPQRVTPKPVIAGAQTAVVVGPAGEEISCDQYGRVKVQFFWDRQGKKDASSSCWLRVAQVWAGKGWGAFFWPRIGHEVVVVFEEGDPDQPMIVGSVYNAENMPWFSLPINKQLAGIKSASVRGSTHQNFNAIVFNDEKSHEHLAIHSERNLTLNSESDKMIHAGRHKGERVAIANVLTVGKFIPAGEAVAGVLKKGIRCQAHLQPEWSGSTRYLLMATPCRRPARSITSL